jgi:hypothetical protein
MQIESTWKNQCVKHFFSSSHAHYCELVSDVMKSALPATASRTRHRSGGRALFADGEPMRKKKLKENHSINLMAHEPHVADISCIRSPAMIRIRQLKIRVREWGKGRPA